MNAFVSPVVHSLVSLLKNNDFQVFLKLLEDENQVILRELAVAQEDKDLRIIQGKCKMLKKIQTLADDTVNRALAKEK